jgi:TonB family protein
MPGLAGFDSIVRARAGSGREVSETFAVQPPTMNAGSQRTAAFAREEQINSAQRAQLIGALPTPRYPAALGGVEGEVRVRFDVDPTGHPVMSSLSVVSSPNALLTGAVLKVIPGMRFEPARSGGTDSKPVSDVVALTFQFKTSK